MYHAWWRLQILFFFLSFPCAMPKMRTRKPNIYGLEFYWMGIEPKYQNKTKSNCLMRTDKAKETSTKETSLSIEYFKPCAMACLIPYVSADGWTLCTWKISLPKAGPTSKQHLKNYIFHKTLQLTLHGNDINQKTLMRIILRKENSSKKQRLKTKSMQIYKASCKGNLIWVDGCWFRPFFL